VIQLLDKFFGWFGAVFQEHPRFRFAVAINGLVLINWYLVKKLVAE
jgi:hypothetical protein